MMNYDVLSSYCRHQKMCISNDSAKPIVCPIETNDGYAS